MKKKLIFAFVIPLLLGACTKQVQKSTKNEFVPEWAKKVVWYQIFPERFRNGDPSNDPKLADQRNSWPFDSVSAWKMSPWGADWYTFQDFEKENGKEIWYQIQRRRYGGDLQGIIDKLDEIRETGFGSIYLNPVFYAPSLHKYDQASYHHIDPNFGPDPEGDRKIIAGEQFDKPETWKWTSADLLALKLIDEVHKRNMKIIFDGVFNHVGMNFPAFVDVQKNQSKSAYKDWFTVKSWNDKEKGTQFDYEGWFGIKQLPELREDSTGIVQGPKQYIFDATTRWMKPEVEGKMRTGIDGWRLDVAFCVNHRFWKDWRKHVKALNPEAYITGEIVDSISKNQEYLQGDEFDGVMNYNFMMNVSEFFINKEKRISTTEFDRKMHELFSAYPGGSVYTVQNLMDSHDTQRLLSFIVNPDVGVVRDWGKGFFDKTKASNPNYSTRKPDNEHVALMKLIVAYQMTCPGAPMIYYGDEIGMWGANDPCCRKPMIWSDIKYDDEIRNADGTSRISPETVVANLDLKKYFKTLIQFRNESPALQFGSYKTLFIDDNRRIYAFERTFEDEKVIVVLNNFPEKNSFQFSLSQSGAFIDIISGKTMKTTGANVLAQELQSYGVSILKMTK